MPLYESIDFLPKTSPITTRRLKSLGINTYWDLINFFPFRYEDYSIISPIAFVQEGERVTIQGKITQSQNIFTRSGLRIQKIVITDSTGSIESQWFNQSYLTKLLHPDLYVSISGEAKTMGKKMVLFPKDYELCNELTKSKTKHTGRIVPVYSEKNGLSTKTIREKIWGVLNDLETDEIAEFLPKDIVFYNELLDEMTAYQNIHFPATMSYAERARKRISFDELFIMQFSSRLIKKEWENEIAGNLFHIDVPVKKRLEHFIKHLPFRLTKAQERAINEILTDLKRTRPMNRFLQGEVGSGKTVIAAIASYCSYLNGSQSLFMAPTEILAEQHFKTITGLFNSKSHIQNNKAPKIILITGSIKPSIKEVKNADIIIGTHALIQKSVSFSRVGLVVIDEQHRFGVTQRKELKNKGLHPHLLTMTATPIPRTVMLTLYGELDMSVLDEMPIGRLPIKTYFIPKRKRQDCYQWIKKQINDKHIQVYIICPLIEESEAETLQSIRAVKKEYHHLKDEIFKDHSIGLLHGKLPSKEKRQVMDDFNRKKYDILVATPVVEVGIDVPNATIMIIEGAERFGLAQLHQLRGRVGRGSQQSYCFAFSENEDASISKRLSYFSKTQDGNSLAQKDLELRGPGNLYGVEQHGYMELKVASLSDYGLIEKTRKAVDYFTKHCELKNFKELEKRVEKLKVEQISKD